MLGSGRIPKRPSSPSAALDEATSTFTQRLDRGFDEFARQFGRGSATLATAPAPTHQRRVSTIGRLDFSGLDEGDDDHPLRHSPPKKLQRLSNDESDSNRFALIQAKAAAALQLTTTSRLRRELAEEKADHLRAQRRLRELEEKLSQDTLNGERSRANELNRSMEARDLALSGKESFSRQNTELHNELAELHAQLAEAKDSAAQKESDLQRELNELRSELMTERSARSRFESDADRLGQDIDTFRNRNGVLMEELTRSIERAHQAEKLQKEAMERLRKFEDECQLAMNMRNDMLELTRLRADYDALRQKAQQYKSNCDNTALLKEKLAGLESRVVRLEAENATLLKENNELKASISQNSRRDGQESRMVTIDSLTQQLVAFSQRNAEQEDRLRLAQERVRDLEISAAQRTSVHESALSDLNQRLSTAIEELSQFRESSYQVETLERDVNEMRVQCESWRAQVADKDEEIARLAEQLNRKVEEARATMTSSAAGMMSSSGQSGESDALIKKLQATVAEQKQMIEDFKERLHMKGDFNPDTTKVLHMAINPIDMAHQEYKHEVETLKKENEQMRLRLEEFEAQRGSSTQHDADVTERVQLRLDELQHERQLNELKEKIVKLEKEKQRAREIQSQLAHKYREMCTQLTGFQCKMKDENLYQVESVYEPGHFFLFKRSDEGDLQLLESDYTPQWADFVETYLMTDHCIPAFLAAVTMQLYARDGKSDMQHDDTTASSQA